MKRPVIVYGVISGTIISAFMAISMLYMDKNEGSNGIWAMVAGYLSMLIAFSFVFVGVKNYRDNQNNGIISFGKAFGTGLLIALIASTMYVATWAVVYNNFLPDFMDKYTAGIIEQAKTSLSGAALDAKISKMNKTKEMYATPVGFALLTYAEILPAGMLVSLIAALVLRRKKHKHAVA